MDQAPCAKCSCSNCGIHLEFPISSQGTEIACPSCGQRTILTVPEEHTTTDIATAGWSGADMASAVRGRIARPSVSFGYLSGLTLVASAMVLLPILYLGLIGLAIWLTYAWAVHGRDILPSGYHGLYAALIVVVIYIGPIFGGAMLVLFMVKPIFARRPHYAQPLALNAGAEPLLFSFVSQICRAVGAPFPKRIDVSCRVDASAHLRRGFRSFVGDDLVLTLGLPLVATVDIKELAGIVAHELGHFRQGTEMRLSYVVFRINGWLERVVFQRDAWDVFLEEAAETESMWLALIVACARFAVWVSRLILILLVLVSHAICCFMARQSEYQADACSIRLVGSAGFESFMFRLHLLDLPVQNAYRAMQDTWNRQRGLPVDFCAFLQAYDQAMPAELRTTVQDRLGLASTRFFHTHPSLGDRIRRARRMAVEGIFHLEGPADRLFSNFEVLSRQVTLLHYADDLGLPVGQARFYAVSEKPDAEKDPGTPDTTAAAAPLPGDRRLRIARPQ